MRRTLVLMLVVCLAVGLAGSAYAGTAFIDTTGDPDEAAIAKLAALGIIRGSTSRDGLVFRPRDSITRTEFAIVMLRALGREKAAQAITDRPAFTDVGESYRWAWGYISLAAQDGLIKGYDGKFRPGDMVTRPEALTMLVRALGREPMVDTDCLWPIGHITMAAQLGIDALTALIGNFPATRGMVAQYLATVLAVPLVELSARGDVTSTGKSFLSLQGCTEAMVRIHATSPPGVAPAWVECSGSALRPGDDDTAVLRIELSPGMVLYGPDDIAGLAGHSADVICGLDGRLVYATPMATISGTVSQVNLPQVTLTDGSVVDIDHARTYRATGLTVPLLGPNLLDPGLAVTFTFGPGDIGKVSCIDMCLPMSSMPLEFRDGHYCLVVNAAVSISVWPGDPAGWIDQNTSFTMNGITVDEPTLRRELSNQARVCSGTFVMDPLTGKASSLQATVFDDMSTVDQPLVTRVAGGFTIPGMTPDDAVSYSLAPDAVVTRDGSPATMGDLTRGDLLSFHTDGSGQVSFVSARPDTESPMVVWYPDETNAADRACVSLSEALDPGTISVAVDGIHYSLTSVVSPAIDGDTFIPVYQPGDRNGDRMTLMIWPRLDFSDGLHTITVSGCDYAGNQVQETLTIEYDSTPAMVRTIVWSPDGTTAKITFDDNMDGASITSLNHWFCPARGENGASEARYDAATRTLTLVMKSGFRGVTVVSEKLADAAGNTVDVTFTTPK